MKKVRVSWFIIAFVGIILSLSCSAMYQNQRFDLEQFYQTGTIYNYPSQWYNVSTDTVYYDAAENQLNVTSDEAVEVYWLETDAYQWNYILCDIKDMNIESMHWNVELLNETGAVTGTVDWELKKGENILSPGNYKFKGLVIHINGQKGLCYTIDSVTFRDQLSTFSMTKFLKVAVIIFCIYLPLAAIIYLYLKKKKYAWNFYAIVDGLQTLFIRVGQWGLYCKWSKRKRSFVRTSLFLAIFMISLIFTNLELYSDKDGYKYMTALCIILTYVMVFISVEKPLERKNWKTPVTAAWFSLWGLVIISDFVVDKFYCYVGWMMLLCMTFFYFVVQNMENPFQIIDELAHAFEVTFCINVVGNLLCRPQNPGQRYCGIYKNPNVFSFYLITIICCFFLELDKCKIKGKKKTLRYVVGIALAVEQLWLAQSLTGFLMLLFVMAIWLLRRRMLYHMEKQHMGISGKRLLKGMAACGISLICMWTFSWGINHLPQILGTQVIYPVDFYQMELPRYSWSMDVWAAEGNAITNSRIYQKLFQSHSLESFTTGRNDLFKLFLQNMNLWGHYYKLEVAGSKWSAHNECIGMAYRYGVFTIIPYGLFLIYVAKSVVIRFFKYYKENPYVSFIAGIVAVCILKLLSDKFEQPFRSAGWMLFYYLIGFLLCNEEKERRKRNDIGEESQK